MLARVSTYEDFYTTAFKCCAFDNAYITQSNYVWTFGFWCHYIAQQIHGLQSIQDTHTQSNNMSYKNESYMLYFEIIRLIDKVQLCDLENYIYYKLLDRKFVSCTILVFPNIYFYLSWWKSCVDFVALLLISI